MSKLIYFFVFVIAALGFTACEQEMEQFTSDPSAKLRFSADSLVFDTVFTTVGSVTKRLWVYNDLENALNISSIKLNKNKNAYHFIVNGQSQTSYVDIPLLGKDSIQVLVSVNIDPGNDNLPFIVDDFLEFETNGNAQQIALVAWGQDAHFVPKSVLACNTTWVADKPYVLLDTVFVDEDCKLTIEKGVRVHANYDVPIIIAGSLEAKGTFKERILITNSRLDEDYANAPGQWRGILFAESSNGNTINCTDIRNAINGIWLGTPDEDTDPDLVLSNSKIENMSGIGLLAFTSDIYAYNTLINNCGQYAVGNFAGGNYTYEHCTFANYSFDFFREEPAVVFTDNFQLTETEVLVGDVDVKINNSILWGSLADELLVNDAGGQLFNFKISNSLIKTNDSNFGTSNILNDDPKFIDPSSYNYKLDTLSPAKDKGISSMVVTDLEGVDRDIKPDLGSYERVEK